MSQITSTKYKKIAGNIKIDSSDPQALESGDMYFNSTDGIFHRHNGTNKLGLQMTTTSTSSSTTTTTSTSTTTS